MWRTQPIFVSSTFRDMNAERDLIATRVLPDLQEACETIGVLPSFIDLRWGVNTSDLSSDQAKESAVLQVCLDEIERCEPYMIVLLGGRYGWVPAQPLLEHISESKGMPKEAQVASVTSLEIEFGAFHRSGAKCFFYFRDPLDTTHMPPEQQALYSDALEDPESYQRLQNLKSRIEREFPGKVRHYCCRWDASQARITGLDALAEMVRADLLGDIQSSAQEIRYAQKDGWVSEERRVQERFAFEQAQLPFLWDVGQMCQKMEMHRRPHMRFASTLGCDQVLYALLIDALALLEGRPLVLPFAFSACGRADTLCAMLAVWNSILAEQLGTPRHFANLSCHQQMQAFAELVAQLNRPITCLLYQATSANGSFLHDNIMWLPQNCAVNIVHVYDMSGNRSNTRFNKFLASLGAAHMKYPMEQKQQPNLVSNMAAYHHKNLSSEVKAALIARLEQGIPEYAYACLHLFVNDLSMMDQQEFDLLNARYATEAPARRLDLYLLERIETLPVGYDALEQLFELVVARLAKRLRPDFVRHVLAILAFCPGKVGEADVLAILERAYGMKDCQVEFSWVLKWLRPILMRTEYEVKFREEYYLEAARHLYSPLYEEYIQPIADYLVSLPDEYPLKREGALLVFLNAGRHEALFDYLNALVKEPAVFYACTTPLWNSMYRRDADYVDPILPGLVGKCRDQQDFLPLLRMVVDVGIPYFSQVEYFAYIQRIAILTLEAAVARHFFWNTKTDLAQLMRLLTALPTENLSISTYSQVYNLPKMLSEIAGDIAGFWGNGWEDTGVIRFLVEHALFVANVEIGNPNLIRPDIDEIPLEPYLFDLTSKADRLRTLCCRACVQMAHCHANAGDIESMKEFVDLAFGHYQRMDWADMGAEDLLVFTSCLTYLAELARKHPQALEVESLDWESYRLARYACEREGYFVYLKKVAYRTLVIWRQPYGPKLLGKDRLAYGYQLALRLLVDRDPGTDGNAYDSLVHMYETLLEEAGIPKVSR